MREEKQNIRSPLVILTGPTAVGKTELSIALAKEIGGEIISADSMQVYRYMDIGSAKIRAEEMQGVPHFLIDEFRPDEEFNVVKFQEYAKRYMKEILARGNVPVLVGGTGFYIQALLYDIDFTKSEENSELRIQLEQFAEEQGAEKLHERLAAIDAKAAEQIHPNNTKRIIRAIEFYVQTGQKISKHNEKERQRTSPYNSAYFVLNEERQVLYRRIEKRVDKMIEQGLFEEVAGLKEMGCTKEMPSMQGLGYKEVLDALDGGITREEAIYRIKRDTRHFAKRQLTWFKRERDVIWIDKPQFERDEKRILACILEKLRERKII